MPTNWKIHPILSVAQLEPGPKNKNPYDPNSKPNKPPPIAEFNKNWHEYEIEKLVGRRTKKYGKNKPLTKYLVKWKNFGLENDTWYGTNLLTTTKKFMAKYETKY